MLEENEIRAIAEAGGAAPSGGNAQAWQLVVRGDVLELALDEERSTSFIDVGRTASMLALGSFVENASIAAEALGLEHRVEILPWKAASEPLVRIEVTGRGPAPSEPPPRHRAIAERATNRKPSNGVPLDEAHVGAMRDAVRELGTGYGLHAFGTTEEKAKIASVLAEADVVRTFERRYHEQMLSEMRWTPEEAAQTRDGIDIATLELPKGALTGLKLMRWRAFVAIMVSRARIRTMTEAALAESSHLACVSMPRTATPEELVIAGRALERAWLEATVRGLAIQPWCVLPFFALRAEREPATLGEIERTTVLDLDTRLSALFAVPEGARAIFVFRLSHADPPSVRALRRPWASFTRRA